MITSTRFGKCYGLLCALGNRFRSVALLLIRLAWGFQLAESGYGHLTHIDKTVKFFASLHIPHAHAAVYMSGSVELVGGVLLMVGLFSRLISIPIFVNFCVAYATASREEISKLLHFGSPDDFINDAAFPFLVTSLIIFAFGPGRASLDAFVFRKPASRN